MRLTGAALAGLGAIALGASTWWQWYRAPGDAGFIYIELPTWYWFTLLDLVLAAAAAVAIALAGVTYLPGHEVRARRALLVTAVVAAVAAVYRMSPA